MRVAIPCICHGRDWWSRDEGSVPSETLEFGAAAVEQLRPIIEAAIEAYYPTPVASTPRTIHERYVVASLAGTPEAIRPTVRAFLHECTLHLEADGVACTRGVAHWCRSQLFKRFAHPEQSSWMVPVTTGLQSWSPLAKPFVDLVGARAVHLVGLAYPRRLTSAPVDPFLRGDWA